MTCRVIALTDGKQVVVSSDPTADCSWLSIWANGGSLGLALDDKSLMELEAAISLCRKSRRKG